MYGSVLSFTTPNAAPPSAPTSALASSRLIRFAKRTVSGIAILACIAVQSISTSALAQGTQHFTALLNGDYQAFHWVPAYLSRVYVSRALTILGQRCADPSLPRGTHVDAISYMAQPHYEKHGLAGLAVSQLANADLVRFTSGVEVEKDVAWLVEQSSCAGAKYRDWVTHAKRFLSDPRLAGPLPTVAPSCEQYSGQPQTCQCFVRSFDMEATPVTRRTFLDARSALEGFQKTLADGNFALRAEYKCAEMPALFRPETMVALHDGANQPDDGQRLKEGVYRAEWRKTETGVGLDVGRWTISRLGDWRYEFKRTSDGKTLRGIGILSGRQVTAYFGQPTPASYTLSEDGTLRTPGRDGGHQYLIPPFSEANAATCAALKQKIEAYRVAGNRDFLIAILRKDHDNLCPQSSAPTADPVPVSPPNVGVESALQPDRHRSATPQQCARLQSDIERFRGDPRRAHNLAILEKRYAEWCAGR